jgi:MoaA/NifB/PqqE/SkfB family radical SAM enzyme/glutaredoxin-related protein
MKKLEEVINFYRENFSVLDVISLAGWTPDKWMIQWDDFRNQLSSLRKETFDNNERIVFIFDIGDYDDLTFEIFFKRFIKTLNKIDVTNFFSVILINDDGENVKKYFNRYSSDPTLPQIDYYNDNNARSLIGGPRDTFCVAPWLHLMTTPYHEIKTCCSGTESLDYLNKKTLADTWNNDSMKEIRKSLLNDSFHTNCEKCYEQEKNSKRSLRLSLNQRFKNKIAKIKSKKEVLVEDFKLLYLDMRFTNLCNIRCRTCNHHSSSKWYHDTKILNPAYDKSVIMKSGRTDTDLWEQIRPHLDHVEGIDFLGGEPLIMDEHYRILEELERRERFDVVLFYNTNFTNTKLKTRTVFDYWRRFDSVAVGASLDAMGTRAEYIRKDCIWSEIEHNRRQMIKECPDVKFNISATVSILNAWHLPDFHRDWVEKGLISPTDIELNWVQEPSHYRIDIATDAYKKIIRKKIQAHCEWLSRYPGVELVLLQYESLVNFMFAEDRSHLLDEFWQMTRKLDKIRNENIIDVLPELDFLK